MIKPKALSVDEFFNFFYDSYIRPFNNTPHYVNSFRLVDKRYAQAYMKVKLGA